jgi:hypothetical protein
MNGSRGFRDTGTYSLSRNSLTKDEIVARQMHAVPSFAHHGA